MQFLQQVDIYLDTHEPKFSLPNPAYVDEYGEYGLCIVKPDVANWNDGVGGGE